MQRRLGIAARVETVAQIFEFAPERSVVVDLTVEGDHQVAVLADHGLIPTREIDDLQAHGTQGNGLRMEDVLLVGAAVEQRCRHPAADTFPYRPEFMRKTGYATHAEDQSPIPV